MVQGSPSFRAPSLRATGFLLAASLCWGTVAASTLVVTPAQAQTKEELAAARAQFQQGLSLEAAGDFKAALERFEAVGRVKLTPQVRFHIARCKEELGRLTEALGDYRMAEYEATEAKVKETDEIAAAREALEAKIPRIVLEVAEGAPRVTVVLDGTELGIAKLGKDVFVDPGEHSVVARWAGGKRSKLKFKLGVGESKHITLEPPDGAGDDDGDDEPAEDAGSGEGQGGASTPPPGAGTEGGASAWPWVAGGVGVAGFVLAGVFYTQMNSATSALDGQCRGSLCPEKAKSHQDDGERAALLTNLSLGVGVVGVGAAVVLFLTQGGASAPAPAAPEAQRGTRLKWNVATSPSYTGVNLVGGF